MAADHVNDTWNEHRSTRFEIASKRTISKYDTAKPQHFKAWWQLHGHPRLQDAGLLHVVEHGPPSVDLVATAYTELCRRDGAPDDEDAAITDMWVQMHQEYSSASVKAFNLLLGLVTLGTSRHERKVIDVFKPMCDAHGLIAYLRDEASHSTPARQLELRKRRLVIDNLVLNPSMPMPNSIGTSEELTSYIDDHFELTMKLTKPGVAIDLSAFIEESLTIIRRIDQMAPFVNDVLFRIRRGELSFNTRDAYIEDVRSYAEQHMRSTVASNIAGNLRVLSVSEHQQNLPTPLDAPLGALDALHERSPRPPARPSRPPLRRPPSPHPSRSTHPRPPTSTPPRHSTSNSNSNKEHRKLWCSWC